MRIDRRRCRYIYRLGRRLRSRITARVIDPNPKDRGFNPGQYAADYGLVGFDLPTTLAELENLLRNHGPLIVSGHIGAVRIIPVQAAGHYILVVGVTATDIEYLDPLRPQHALGFEPTSMQLNGFLRLANARGLLADP